MLQKTWSYKFIYLFLPDVGEIIFAIIMILQYITHRVSSCLMRGCGSFKSDSEGHVCDIY